MNSHKLYYVITVMNITKYCVPLLACIQHMCPHSTHAKPDKIHVNLHTILHKLQHEKVKKYLVKQNLNSSKITTNKIELHDGKLSTKR